MRTTFKLSIAAFSLAAGIAACADARASDTAAQDDLKRDLELAASATMNLASPQVDPSLLTLSETKSQSEPQKAAVVKKGAGSRAIRSQTPTVRATTDAEVAALDESEVTETLAEAPAPEVIDEPVAVAPRPTPVVIQTGGSGDYGTSGNGGIFGGGMGGVVIRGGGVDGDNCELHRNGGSRGRGGIIFGRPSVPTTGGSIIVNRMPGSIGSGGGARRSSAASGASRARASIAQTVSRPTLGRPRGR